MTKKEFNVTAIVAIRNGSYYFPQFCQHARNNGISLAVIDNESEDNLQELIRRNSDVVIHSSMLQYNGVFELTKQLEAKQSIAQTLNADWIIHLDIDELIYSEIEGETLQAAIKRVHEAGFNAINFDEFVFLPIEITRFYSKKNYHKMRWYYFFEPRPRRLMRAFHRDLRTRVKSGGHDLEGKIDLYPENMILRHFMFENRSHAKVKYQRRTYSQQDIKNRFHKNRIAFQSQKVVLPPKISLIKAAADSWKLDTSNPKFKHFWEW